MREYKQKNVNKIIFNKEMPTRAVHQKSANNELNTMKLTGLKTFPNEGMPTRAMHQVSAKTE